LDGEVFDQATPITAKDDSLVNEFVGLLGMAKSPSPEVYNHWSGVFAQLVKEHGEAQFRNVRAYCFANERYCRGIKTTAKDKADWFTEKFQGMADKMSADDEFESRRGHKAAAAKVPENAPDYRKNPTGRDWFGKSVV
jgi:hypothetical protein